jgi:hypothetical protein
VSSVNKLAILFCAGFLGSCSSTRPQNVGVDEEAVLVDLDACMADSTCHSPKVVTIDYVLPGKGVVIPPGEFIKAPVHIPPSPKKLAYLVLGLGTPYLRSGQSLTVTFDCRTSAKSCPPLQPLTVTPAPGTSRNEIQLASPPTDAYDLIEIEHTVKVGDEGADSFILLWVVGRWSD